MRYFNDFISIEDNSLLETSFFEEIDRWKTHNDNHAIQKFKSTSISDADYNKIKENIKIMRKADNYEDYKKAFSRFCYFCHIVPRGVILKKYELKRGKENHNSLYVEYSYNTKKMILPEDTILYHMTAVDGIRALNPFFRGKTYFRGKTVSGFMYDKPRIYFTIRKNMPKFLADYKMNEKLNIYVAKEKIKQVFVDPLVWSNLQGAVYVETNRPVPVEKLTKSRIADLIDKLKGKNRVNESGEIDFEDFYSFVTENGLTLIDEGE